jgi:hypothetical protein
VFVTGDQNLEFQQNISNRRLGVVVLCATSNALEDLQAGFARLLGRSWATLSSNRYGDF